MNIVHFERFKDSAEDLAIKYRAIIYTASWRRVYLEIEDIDDKWKIRDCFYADRNFNKKDNSRFTSKPSKFDLRAFEKEDMLRVLNELLHSKCKKFVMEDTETMYLGTFDFLEEKLGFRKRGYNILVFVGEGHLKNGVPTILKTRIKTKLYKVVELSIKYDENIDKGIIESCQYCWENNPSKKRKAPDNLVTYIFDYSKEVILDIVNNELCNEFTHVIFTDAESLDYNSNLKPIC